jgi:hypothetical protein
LLWPIATQATPLTLAAIDAGFTNPATVHSPIGTNLASITDYTAEYPFVNFFHMARPWFSASAAEFQNEGKLKLDKNGNVKSLASGQFARTVIFTGTPADPGLAGKTFELFYDGSGELSYGNVDVISQSPGHDVIQLKSDISSPDTELIAIITLTQTDKKNPLRNIRLLPTGGICAGNPLAIAADATACAGGDFRSFAENQQQIVFNPEFLNEIKSYHSLRFMDWMRTNNSLQVKFSKRAQTSHQFWSTEQGVPLEVMIALANLMDMDPWFNIPHLANNGFVKGFAKILNEQLEPGRRAYIEYSNEVWNGQFTQTAYAATQGEKLHLDILDGGSKDAATGMVRFYSKRAQQIFDIVGKVMKGNARIQRVMATQAPVPYFSEEILKFGEGSTKTDLMAIAPYFGDTITENTKSDELVKLGVDGVFDWLANDNNATLDYGSLPKIDSVVAAQVAALAPFNIPLTTYEGGQHFLAAGGVAHDVALNDLMDAVNRDPRMKQIYATYLGNWQTRTGQTFHHFSNCDRWSVFGRWGSKEYPSQLLVDAPKYGALMDFIASKPL